MFCKLIFQINNFLLFNVVYYLFINDYTFPTITQDLPLEFKLPYVKSNSYCFPILVGHAGAGVQREYNGVGTDWPENTICAFRRSEQLGIKMVECDATLTQDCNVVLHHNFTLGINCETDDLSGENKYVMNNKRKVYFILKTIIVLNYP